MFKITKIFILLVVLVAAVIIPAFAASASTESPVRPAKLLSHKYEDVASLQVVGSLHGIKGSPLYQTADLYVKDEIVLRDDSNQILAKSPELYEWLIKDWKKE